MHIVVIGNSAAGLSAARVVRKLDATARITVISDEPGPAYARCLIPEVLAGVKDVSGINYAPQKFYQDFEIDLWSGQKVVSINAERRILNLADGRVIGYDRLLVATGASPVPPGWPGADLPGVFTLRRVDQAVDLGKLAPGCASAVVVGGGLVSLKAAYALKKRGLHDVTVVIKSPHLLIKQLDQDSAGLVEKDFTGAGIKFIYGMEPVAVTAGHEGTVRAVELEDGRKLHAGLVVVGKGVRPNSELVRQAGGRVDKGIVVNDYLETSLPGVYAAGDCIEVTDLVTGAKTTSGLWTLAVEQGRYAGCNLAGQTRKYPPPLTRLNSAQFRSVPFISVGDVRGGDEQVVYKDNRVYRKLCFKEGRLVGFIMVGRVDRAGVYTALIKRQKQLPGRLKDRLVDGTVTGADIAGLK
ncbi:NAD(P)/FAD-dependent oxidoreductase [Desulfallas sp. Bu1-1]|uniref:NAD(P)/FAD-dependent oxidoreductase n=1 Tax=Desulfallas sp. Bu1-1 TaxID=2787620 RepID=UPI00189E1C11|nr:FAD-dependent oxidoreductase [Desulfallas sp. Bu1-1]MBF7081800.1 NAD(P)/FAD-dependent oxidoreductase [Desulfallas sp. Bu1-1]